MPTKTVTTKNGWQKLKLGNGCISIFSGGTPNTSISNYWNGNIPWLSSGETRKSFINITEKTITLEGVHNSSTRKAIKDDIVIATAGQGLTRGQISFLNIETYINQSIIAIRTNPKFFESKYLFYNLKSRYQELRGLSDSTSTRGSITCPMLSNLDVEIPPLPVQKKIAEVLGTYDDLIEVNQKKIKILENMAQTIYKEWFVKPVKNGLPDGWEIKKVENLIKRIPVGKKYDNKTANPVGAVPILDQGRSGFIGYHNDEPGVIATPENPVIVFANHTCYENLVMFPFSAIQNVLPFVPIDEHDIIWLYYTTKDLVSFNDYKGHWPEFMAKRISVPSIELSKKFGGVIKPILIQKFTLEKQNQNLQKTRDLLIPQLVGGRVSLK